MKKQDSIDEINREITDLYEVRTFLNGLLFTKQGTSFEGSLHRYIEHINSAVSLLYSVRAALNKKSQ